jgi:transcriptional regulator with XRE-family HTH domain
MAMNNTKVGEIFILIGYGDFIKKHRLTSGFRNKKSLAEKTGISAATISRIEREIQKPEVRTLATLAKELYTTSFHELMQVCNYTSKDEKTYELTENGYNPKIISFLKLLEKSDLTDNELNYLIQQAELSINFIKRK